LQRGVAAIKKWHFRPGWLGYGELNIGRVASILQSVVVWVGDRLEWWCSALVIGYEKIVGAFCWIAVAHMLDK